MNDLASSLSTNKTTFPLFFFTFSRVINPIIIDEWDIDDTSLVYNRYINGVSFTIFSVPGVAAVIEVIQS